VPWSVEEKEAVKKYFKAHTMFGKSGRMHECEDAKKKYPVLCKRSWRHIKDCVKNLTDSYKKQKQKL